jgi:hypothetical protein
VADVVVAGARIFRRAEVGVQAALRKRRGIAAAGLLDEGNVRIARLGDRGPVRIADLARAISAAPSAAFEGYSSSTPRSKNEYDPFAALPNGIRRPSRRFTDS